MEPKSVTYTGAAGSRMTIDTNLSEPKYAEGSSVVHERADGSSTTYTDVSNRAVR